MARGQALGNLFGRFTADRDSLYTAIQDCQHRIATLAARLEANGGHGDGSAAPAAAAVSPEALECLQDVPALRRDLEALRNTPAVASDADDRLAALRAELDAFRQQSAQALEVAQQALERASGLKGLEAAHQGLRAEVASLGRALDERPTAPSAGTVDGLDALRTEVDAVRTRAEDTASRVERALEVAEQAMRGTSLAALEADLQGLAAEIVTPDIAGALTAVEGEVQALRDELAAMRERTPGAPASLEPLRTDVEALSEGVRAQAAGAAEMRIEIARLAQVTQEALRHATRPPALHPDAADRRELRELEDRLATRLAGALTGLEQRLQRSERDLVLMHTRVVEVVTVQASLQRRGILPLVRALVETASTVVGTAVSALTDLASTLRGTLFAR